MVCSRTVEDEGKDRCSNKLWMQSMMKSMKEQDGYKGDEDKKKKNNSVNKNKNKTEKVAILKRTLPLNNAIIPFGIVLTLSFLLVMI